jgi:hypothetical protein
MRDRNSFAVAWICLALALGCFAFGVYLDPDRDVPRYADLKDARGQVRDIREVRRGKGTELRFSLVGEERTFYTRLLGNRHDLIMKSSSAEFAIKYEGFPGNGRGRQLVPVWQISTGDSMIASYEELRKMTRGNTWLGRFGCFMLGAIFLFYGSRSWVDGFIKNSRKF